jgi:hypothetical protein
MAHHVAELIDQAESERSGARRLAAKREAVSTILKIWEHRRSLPRGAYPLAAYDELLRFIDLLRPRTSPFGFFRHGSQTDQDELFCRLFAAFSRLLGVILLTKVGELGGARAARSSSAVKALSPAERRLHVTISRWMDLVGAERSRSSKGRKQPKRKATNEMTLQQVAISWMDEIEAVIPGLRLAISSGGQSVDN